MIAMTVLVLAITASSIAMTVRVLAMTVSSIAISYGKMLVELNIKKDMHQLDARLFLCIAGYLPKHRFLNHEPEHD
ncbi:hypothetical protein [Sporosarcina sp. SG10008]|uniref:hypothetical protein n=1 Tax=Sporosarcina sp. SG10008 TaxID=3373103 RepID=UPI0037DD401F